MFILELGEQLNTKQFSKIYIYSKCKEMDIILDPISICRMVVLVNVTNVINFCFNFWIYSRTTNTRYAKHFCWFPAPSSVWKTHFCLLNGLIYCISSLLVWGFSTWQNQSNYFEQWKKFDKLWKSIHHNRIEIFNSVQ